MTSQPPNNAESSKTTESQQPLAPVPKLHVKGPLSKDSISIHYSSLGMEEEEEEEAEPCLSALDLSVVSLGGTRFSSAWDGSSIHKSRPLSTDRPSSYPAEDLLSSPIEQKLSSNNSFSTKSLSFPSNDKPFLSFIKTASPDADSQNTGAAAPTSTLRHRQLVKNLVKSLSTDSSQETSATAQRPAEHRLNLQLFKQFAQSRLPVAMVASTDSKTPTALPLPSDNRGFFNVSEVEARIEGTKRRLTEAISEPLQMLSKIIDEKSVGIHRPKGQPAGPTDLAKASVNGHVESNNNSCVADEKERESEAESSHSWTSIAAETPGDASTDNQSPGKSFLSMSTLAKQDEEDFWILGSEDFEPRAATEDGGVDGTNNGERLLVEASDENSDDESEETLSEPNIPKYPLIFLTALVYGWLVLPLPAYFRGILLGMGLGFLLAIVVVWVAGLKQTRPFKRKKCRNRGANVSRLEIEEPDIYKGWMNEIQNYDPETYHATLTHSVYVRLEGSIIRLSKPNRNIPRRASHNEPKPEVTYISQKIYDLTDSKVSIVPHYLARKRIWNKKYPICIELRKQDDFMSKAEGEESSSDTSNIKEGFGRSSQSSKNLTLYLFGRTGREKEQWFQKFLLAANRKMEKASSISKKTSIPKNSSNNQDEAFHPQPRSKDSSSPSLTGSINKSGTTLDYNEYMSSFLPKQTARSPAANSPEASSPLPQSAQSSPGAEKKLSNTIWVQLQPVVVEESVAWVNAALGRLSWDILNQPYWTEMISKKIQMKLSRIRLPYFMNELTLTELDMGSATPRILKASAPSVDYRGLWFDLEVSYDGSFLMILETKMILHRLRKDAEGEFGKEGHRPRTYCLADSDEESSSAGSSDEEDPSEPSNDSGGSENLIIGHKPSKIMRFVDKITKSKYFQKATETEFIKKKMDEVSNTPLLLTVEVQQLQGNLAVNIPPPPTDRIWYGFRTPPYLVLRARPKLGEREVTLAHVTDWIEKKLYQEFQKILVMPNMDDIWLEIMHSAINPHTADEPMMSSELSE